MSRVVNKSSIKIVNCPKCGSPLYKVHRNFIYKLINLFVHIRRFKCVTNQCQFTQLKVSRRQIKLTNLFKPINPLKNKLNMIILIILIMIFWYLIIDSYIVNLGIIKYTEG
jgi:hypothetical protein